MIEIKPSTIFSSGTEYEIFLDNFCYRCKACVLRDDGFPELVENGGAKSWTRWNARGLTERFTRKKR